MVGVNPSVSNVAGCNVGCGYMLWLWGVIPRRRGVELWRMRSVRQALRGSVVLTIAWWQGGEKLGVVACEWCGLMVRTGGKNADWCM